MNEVVELLRGVPDELTTFIVAMLPIAELRGAIPLGILGFDLGWVVTVVISVIGNMVPVVFLLWLLEPLSKALRNRFALWERFFSWLFERTRRKYKGRFARVGDIALVTFVAIPLPITGAWAGSIAALVFGVSRVKAFFLIFVGVLIAAVIVTGITLGIFSLT